MSEIISDMVDLPTLSLALHLGFSRQNLSFIKYLPYQNMFK